jgi:hypothetical protein
MTTADRLYAAEQLLAFLERVGPREAVWAMSLALEVLQEQLRSGTVDHLKAAAQAFEAAAPAKTEELAKAPAPRGKKSPAAAAAPATNGEQP